MQKTTFRTYDLAVQFYRETRSNRLPAHLRDQFNRAASSIALNLHEGWARKGAKDRLRFYRIAFGSIRECQAVFQLEPEAFGELESGHLDILAASTYRLVTNG